MGYVIVISLPLLLLIVILALACFLCGRAKGRYETRRPSQFYGPPAPPPPPVMAQEKVVQA
ncbi:hypothetical protein IHE45_02G097500 [Dioscorea alata]|uniref:Uncharacterized protein n=1 Tax=Dioscorea alata TaxID=55571 RepID=A0ACB7WSU5_DIOAL|nr:hypothetical protein IHE45_02G097500 [Dioscorea alata]